MESPPNGSPLPGVGAGAGSGPSLGPAQRGAARRESPDAVLAKNLVVARVAAGVTQQALAASADVSRATIAQIETGYSDPRLSTIVDLAEALGVPPLFLLLGEQDVRALAHLLGASPSQGVDVPPADRERMRRLLSTGLLKDRLLAARVGAEVARRAGYDTAPVAAAAICSALLPGEGTAVGTLLASFANTSGDEAPQNSAG